MLTPLEAVNTSFANIIRKDADAICAGYFESEDLYVILEGPRLSNRGHAPISKGWRDFCESAIALQSIDWMEGPYEEITSEMACVAGITRLKVSVKDMDIERVFRASFVLTKQDGAWKIKHEHVSAAHDDPYGIGDWLQ